MKEYEQLMGDCFKRVANGNKEIYEHLKRSAVRGYEPCADVKAYDTTFPIPVVGLALSQTTDDAFRILCHHDRDASERAKATNAEWQKKYDQRESQYQNGLDCMETTHRSEAKAKSEQLLLLQHKVFSLETSLREKGIVCEEALPHLYKRDRRWADVQSKGSNSASNTRPSTPQETLVENMRARPHSAQGNESTQLRYTGKEREEIVDALREAEHEQVKVDPHENKNIDAHEKTHSVEQGKWVGKVVVDNNEAASLDVCGPLEYEVAGVTLQDSDGTFRGTDVTEAHEQTRTRSRAHEQSQQQTKQARALIQVQVQETEGLVRAHSETESCLKCTSSRNASTHNGVDMNGGLRNTAKRSDSLNDVGTGRRSSIINMNITGTDEHNGSSKVNVPKTTVTDLTSPFTRRYSLISCNAASNNVRGTTLTEEEDETPVATSTVGRRRGHRTSRSVTLRPGIISVHSSGTQSDHNSKLSPQFRPHDTYTDIFELEDVDLSLKNSTATNEAQDAHSHTHTIPLARTNSLTPNASLLRAQLFAATQRGANKGKHRIHADTFDTSFSPTLSPGTARRATTSADEKHLSTPIANSGIGGFQSMSDPNTSTNLHASTATQTYTRKHSSEGTGSTLLGRTHSQSSVDRGSTGMNVIGNRTHGNKLTKRSTVASRSSEGDFGPSCFTRTLSVSNTNLNAHNTASFRSTSENNSNLNLSEFSGAKTSVSSGASPESSSINFGSGLSLNSRSGLSIGSPKRNSIRKTRSGSVHAGGGNSGPNISVNPAVLRSYTNSNYNRARSSTNISASQYTGIGKDNISSGTNNGTTQAISGVTDNIDGDDREGSGIEYVKVNVRGVIVQGLMQKHRRSASFDPRFVQNVRVGAQSASPYKASESGSPLESNSVMSDFMGGLDNTSNVSDDNPKANVSRQSVARKSFGSPLSVSHSLSHRGELTLGTPDDFGNAIEHDTNTSASVIESDTPLDQDSLNTDRFGKQDSENMEDGHGADDKTVINNVSGEDPDIKIEGKGKKDDAVDQVAKLDQPVSTAIHTLTSVTTDSDIRIEGKGEEDDAVDQDAKLDQPVSTAVHTLTSVTTDPDIRIEGEEDDAIDQVAKLDQPVSTAIHTLTSVTTDPDIRIEGKGEEDDTVDQVAKLDQPVSTAVHTLTSVTTDPDIRIEGKGKEDDVVDQVAILDQPVSTAVHTLTSVTTHPDIRIEVEGKEDDAVDQVATLDQPVPTQKNHSQNGSGKGSKKKKKKRRK
ncbi:hypothetical protein SARC_09117 [Sphaeroforma arctica JP610]|uniref:Uncharacterized protein n=1 Tax=Sphaeroforma arctica JP610 TaxID=667725 RepID=A0A0L0FNY9_9EUKA|nr:hypothetical protein SARC_09117 [Sphaeroforma arctica JP610]KNC78454.1 hypothetical protein SARC_09117 [Sphaeroforma arctica JP610]|eukprot:XP_014152356.1 hypothetical protein SARC_09117 [Sphaeroforma arctica JP610]